MYRKKFKENGITGSDLLSLDKAVQRMFLTLWVVQMYALDFLKHVLHARISRDVSELLVIDVRQRTGTQLCSRLTSLRHVKTMR